MRKLSCNEGVEYLGLVTNAYIDNLNASETAPVMAKYGLVNLDPHGWYPAPKWMAALNELAESGDMVSSLVAIGMAIAKDIPMPPHLNNPTLVDVLMIWDDLYQFLHRCGDVGKIVCEKVSDKHYKTIHTVIYPDDMSYGVLYGFARRFLPPNTRFDVFYDQDMPARDYEGTGDSTIIHVAWE